MTNSVSGLKDLNSQLVSYLSDLILFESKPFNIDFDSLSNLLPSESDYKPFIESIKEHLNKIITQFEVKYLSNFNLFVEFIMRQFNYHLYNILNGKITQLNDHIAQIESSIKSIINKIVIDSLKIVKNQSDSIIPKITSDISNLQSNHDSLNKFDKYNDKFKIARSGIPGNSMNIFENMYRSLSSYKSKLKVHHSDIDSYLKSMKTKLTSINQHINDICKTIESKINGQSMSLDLNEIYKQLLILEFFEKKIPELRSRSGDLVDLRLIAREIIALKQFKNRFKNELDDDFSKAVESLGDISIEQGQMYSYITSIETQISQIIAGLKLTGILLKYKDSIEILRIRAVCINPNIIEFLKDSLLIVQKFTEASQKMESTTQEIEKLKKEHSYLSSYVAGELEQNIKSYNEKIKKFIEKALIYIKLMRYLTYNLLIVIFKSKVFEEIEKKIQQIKDLNGALTNLKEIYYEVLKFYYIQLKTTLFLNFYVALLNEYSKFQSHLKDLNKKIYETNMFIYFVTLYYTILYHINVIVKNMEKLRPEVIGLNKFHEKFKAIRTFVSIIIKKLSDLNSNITKLEKDMMNITPDNLMDKIKKYRKIVIMVRKNIKSIIKTFKYTVSYIDYTVKELKSKSDEITEEIQKSIVYLSRVILVQPFISLPLYIINSKIANQIFRVLSEIKKYLNSVKLSIELYIRNLIVLINYVLLNILILKILLNNIILNIDIIDGSVIELECAIEGVARNFIRCSLLSNSNSTVGFMNNNLGVVELYNQVMSMYSVLNVMDYNVVVNRLFDSAKKIDEILKLNVNIYWCKCIHELEWSNTNIIYLSTIKVYNIIDKIASGDKDEFVKFIKLDRIKRVVQDDIEDNHFCLCMVFKYILYPQIINLTYLMSKDLQTLSTISRKYDSYTQTYFKNLGQFFILCVELLYKLSLYILLKYQYTWVSGHPFHVRCFCMYTTYPGYYSVISTILVLSSLIENIWTMDPENLRTAIERLSTLYSQLEIYDLNSTSLKHVCCNPVYSLLVNKECKDKPAGKCCCCWCPSVVNILVMCISLSFQCKLCKALCAKEQNGCENVKKFCTVEDCQCTCPKGGNGVCCLPKTLCSQVSGSKEQGCKTLEDLLKECCTTCGGAGECCCKKLAGKVKAGNCKLLLLGCECTCTEGTGDIKVKCVFFNNPWGCTSVAVVVFCKCKAEPAKCCCLYELIDKLKPKVSKICEDSNCVCDDLKDGCKDLCCDKDCSSTCPQDCVCQKLKGKLQEICNGKGKCGADGCLCKKIKDVIGNLCKKECECASKKGCCRCACCKIVAHSIKILARACIANVLDPYKRIILDLLGSTKDKQLIKSISERINNGIVNRIFLVKNNLITSNRHEFVNPLNTVKSRNWGYDTQHEHQARSNGIISSYGYPNPLNTDNYYKNTLRKLHHFSSLLSSSVDRYFSLVSSSCLEISS